MGGVPYYTKIKIVAQRWKDLPVRRLQLPVPQIPETQSSRQALSQVLSPTSETDTPGVEVSPATTSTSERNIAGQNVLLSLPQLSRVGSSDPVSISSASKATVRELSNQRESVCMLSMSERATINQEISLSVPTAAEDDLNVRGALLSIYETSERIHIPQIVKAGESLSLKLPMTESDMSTPGQDYLPPASNRTGNTGLTSLRMDISMDHVTESSVPSPHRNGILSLMSGRIDNMGPNYQGTEITAHPTFGSVYAPPASQGADSVRHPKSGGFNILPPQGDLNLTSKVASARIHPGSKRRYLPMSYRNYMVESQRMDSLPSTTGQMYIPSAFKSTDDIPTSEGFGQGMFGQTAAYMGKYSGQGVQPTSQGL